MKQIETKQTQLRAEDIKPVQYDLNLILFNLLHSNTSKWIMSEELNKFILNHTKTQEQLIKDIQYWLVHNKLTRTRARFLEKYCHRPNITLQEYLGLAWSVLFFEGLKLNSSIKVKYSDEHNKPKPKNKKNKFYYTLERIQNNHNLTDKDLLDMKSMLRKLIRTNKLATFKYYGVVKNEWTMNHINYDFLKKAA